MSMFPVRNRFFNELLGDLHGSHLQPWQDASKPHSIKVDVQEQTDSFTVQAELPGVKKEDVQVGVDGTSIIISAEIKKQFSSTETQHELRTERYYGRVARRFELPHEINLDRAEACYEDGLLKLYLPKKKAIGSNTAPNAQP